MTETAWTDDRVAERKRNAYLKEKLSTPEGAAQDCLERSLPPDVRPDTLYILSAQNNSLGLWRVL